jgi:CRP-like cAMP-binding protein
MANSKFSGDVKRTYASGEVIVREGDMDGEMYIIQKGRVSVRKRVGEDELELAILRKGEIFGEMALLEGEPRTSTVYAIEPTNVLVIKSGGFLMRIRRDPTFEIGRAHV